MKDHHRRILLSALSAFFSCVVAGAGWTKPVGGVHVARHQLGFSGATISVREDHRRTKWPAAERTFILVGANGQTRRTPLHTGSGPLSLWAIEDDRYVLIGEDDCVEFDPIRITARHCASLPPCLRGHLTGGSFIGRFDWMNGYDPPMGDFHFDFRFGPPEDAAPGGDCPVIPTSPDASMGKS